MDRSSACRRGAAAAERGRDARNSVLRKGAVPCAARLRRSICRPFAKPLDFNQGLTGIDMRPQTGRAAMPVAFKTLPLIVRIATLATFFNCWVLFEELIVDRQGLDRFMPFYRVGALCVWDL